MGTTLIIIGIAALNIATLVLTIREHEIESRRHSDIAKRMGGMKREYEVLAGNVRELDGSVSSLISELQLFKQANATTLQNIAGNLQEHCGDVSHRLNGIIHDVNSISDTLALYNDVLGEQKRLLECDKAEKEKEERMVEERKRYLHTVYEKVTSDIAEGKKKSEIRKDYNVDGRPCRVSDLDRLLAFGKEMGWELKDGTEPTGSNKQE